MPLLFRKPQRRFSHIEVHILYLWHMLSHSMNMHTNRATNLNVGLSLHLYPYFMGTSSEGSGEAVLMPRLV